MQRSNLTARQQLEAAAAGLISRLATALIRDWLAWAITNDQTGEDWQSNYHRYTASLAEAIA